MEKIQKEIEHLRDLLLSSRNAGDIFQAFLRLKQISSEKNCDFSTKEIIGKTGLIPIALAFMEKKDFVQVALLLVRSLSVHEDNQVMLASRGAVPVLYKCICCNDRSVQLNAASTLWNLSVNDDNKRLIGETGGISLLANLFIKSSDQAIQNAACGALRNLCLCESNKHKIFQHPSLVHHLSRTRKDEKTTAECRKNCDLILQHEPKNIMECRRDTTEDQVVCNIVPKLCHYGDVIGSIEWRGLKIGEYLGGGSYADVYVAAYHNFQVAVKILKQKVPLPGDSREKMFHELRLMSMLRHPNVVLILITILFL
jgi:Armadillo/beta-catenin-like repeat/Protein tyrosine and serine/threonine kinase